MAQAFDTFFTRFALAFGLRPPRVFKYANNIFDIALRSAQFHTQKRLAMRIGWTLNKATEQALNLIRLQFEVRIRQ